MDFIFDEDVDEVGSDIDAFCPKCKTDTPHVVISKYEDEIRRVQCNPCGDVHAYRKPRGETEDDMPDPPVAKKRAAKAKPTWEQVMAKPKKEPKLYVVSQEYKENELISHPKFGPGFVSELMGPDKMEVTFQSGRKTLIHNRQGMSLPPAAYAHPIDATLPSIDKGSKKGKGKPAPVEKAASEPARGKAAKLAPPPAASKPAAKAAATAAKKPAPAPSKKAPDKGAKRPVVAKAPARPATAKPKAKARAAAPARSKPAAARSVKPPAKKVKKR